MPLHQLIGLEHAVTLADGDDAGIERQLQRPLRRLAAGPQMFLVHQHVVVDVADGQRAVLSEQPQHLAQVGGFYACEPLVTLAPVQFHVGNEEGQVFRRHIGQGVGPVLEDAFADALRLTQIGAPIGRDAGPQNMVMRALDDADGVDLHIAQMLHRGRHRLRPLAEGRRGIEPLGAQPDAPRLRCGQGFHRVRSATASPQDRSRTFHQKPPRRCG